MMMDDDVSSRLTVWRCIIEDCSLDESRWAVRCTL